MNVSSVIPSLSKRRPSRIGVRLFAFNLLVVFVPVAGILYLDVYEAKLLEAQEHGMVDQARIVAAALTSDETFDQRRAEALLARIGQQGDARIRVYDGRARLMADSAGVGRVQSLTTDDHGQVATDARRRVLYQVGAKLARVRQRIAAATWRVLSRGQAQPTFEARDDTPSEIRDALAGRYGAASRLTPGQRSLTLSSAVPIHGGSGIVGAVVVSQSTFRVLQALYDVRLRLFEIVLLSMASAAVLTRVASATVVNPIVRLRHTAVALAERRRELSGLFRQVDRKDEIGDLARSLEELAARLDAHIHLLESFAADVSHEFKNPLAAIRAAADTIAESESPAERQRFLTMLRRDVDRLEGLVSGVRELAHIDAEMSSERRVDVDVSGALTGIVEGRRMIGETLVDLTLPPGRMVAMGSLDRFIQVFENLIDNAVSFSPPSQPLTVRGERQDGFCTVTVSDRGPGIPEAHLARVFDRFFSYRPDSDRREHVGLGLAIAKTIVNGYGGTISARNRHGGGAEFEVRLPAGNSTLPL